MAEERKETDAAHETADSTTTQRPAADTPVDTTLPPAVEQPAEGQATDGGQGSTPSTQGASTAGAGTQGSGAQGGRDHRGSAGRGQGRSGYQGGGRGQRRERQPDESGLESSVVRIYRCSKVVKGGRTFSFGALVVAGDRHGNVGIGYGKANEVPPAVEKATKDARKQMFKVNLKGTTIPHLAEGRSGASKVVLVPARPGTGVTAGKSVGPVLELAGITDILTKAYGSTSPKNLVKATIAALMQLQNRDQVEQARGVTLVKGAGELTTA